MTALYPYQCIDQKDKVIVGKTLMTSDQNQIGVFKKNYKEALDFMAAENSSDWNTLSPEVQKCVEDLNQAAISYLPETLDKSTLISAGAWKKVLPQISDLSTDLELIKKLGTLGQQVGALGTVGAALIFKSRNRIVVAAGVVSLIGIQFLKNDLVKLKDCFNQITNVIDLKVWQHPQALESKVDQAYSELQKVSFLIRRYFSAHRSKENNNALQLLNEQLNAHIYLRRILLSLISKSFTGSQKFENADRAKVVEFFKKFMNYCAFGAFIGLPGVGASLLFTYWAFLEKRKLMIVAGLVSFIFAAQWCREFYGLYKGSKNISLLKEDDDVVSPFKEMAGRSFILKSMQLHKAGSLEKIQEACVIPFDAILKLIPTWKEPAK